MLIAIPIAVLLIAPLIVWLLHRWRPRTGYLWLFSLLVSILAWALILALRLFLPVSTSAAIWGSTWVNPVPIKFLVDQFSWPLAFATATLLLAAFLTGVLNPITDQDDPPYWYTWANSLLITGFSLLAAFSGNILTILLTWSALDLMETIIWFNQIRNYKNNKSVVINLSIRIAGSMLLVLGVLTSQTNALSISFADITPQIGSFIILASGLRLGVILVNLRLSGKYLRGPHNVLQCLAPITASLLPLVRASVAGVSPGIYPYLLLLASFAGLYSAISWATAESQRKGVDTWILGVATLALVSAARNQPLTSLVWCISLLMLGGVLFYPSIRTRWMRGILLIGVLSLSSLPFTPTWQGVRIYSTPLHPLLLLILSSNVFLVYGYLRRTFQIEEKPTITERWASFINFLGIILCISAYFLINWWLPTGDGSIQPSNPTWLESLPGFIISALTIGMFYISRSDLKMDWFPKNALLSFLSLKWMYQALAKLFSLLQRVISFISVVTESQSGVLWSLVLLILMISFLIQVAF